MSLETVLAEDRRLVVLRALSEADGYMLNEATLRQAVHYFGHKVGRDILRADIEFLRSHDLVTIETLRPMSGELWLVRLTETGNDVAGGRHHPGVARRTPG